VKGQITVVGAGFVGSIFTDEYLRRAFAGELPRGFRFIDDDKWELRNAANQNVGWAEAFKGTPKAESMAIRAQQFEHEAEWMQVRLDTSNAEELLADSFVIVDAVDNLATRQLLYGMGMGMKVPVLHMGITEGGTGAVEWSHPEHDTFHLSPARTAGKSIKDPVSGAAPPCELARMRGVGLNTSFAAAKALGIFQNFDPESLFHDENCRGWLTDWQATNTSHFAVEETWSKIHV